MILAPSDQPGGHISIPSAHRLIEGPSIARPCCRACGAHTKPDSMVACSLCRILHNRVPPPRARRHLSAAWLRAGRAPGLPAPGSPDMCGCNRAGQAGSPGVPTRSISPAEPRPCNTPARSRCSFAPSIGRPHLRASFRAAAILASSSEQSGNSDRRATRCSSLVGTGQTGCQIVRHPHVHFIGYSAPATHLSSGTSDAPRPVCQIHCPF